MYELPPPQIEISIEVVRPSNKAWNDYSFSFNELLDLLQKFEREEIPDEVCENSIKQLRIAFANFAQIGSLNSSADEIDLLNRDIIELFLKDEDDDLPEFSLGFSQKNGGFSPGNNLSSNVVLCKSFRKRMKHAGKKVARFVRHHIKEIVIGGAVAAGVGAGIYIATRPGENHSSSSPTTNGPSDSSRETHSSKQDQDSTPSTDSVSTTSNSMNEEWDKPIPKYEYNRGCQGAEPQDQSILKESYPTSQLNSFLSNPSLSSPSFNSSSESSPSFTANDRELSFGQKFTEGAREIGAMVAHQLWDVVGKEGSVVLNLERSMKQVGDSFLPKQLLEEANQHGNGNFFTLDQAHEAWRKFVADGHKKIDECMASYQAILYDESLERQAPFVIGEIPLPSNLINKLTEVSKFSKAIQAGQKATLLAEEFGLSSRQVSQLINEGALEKRVGTAIETALGRKSVSGSICVRPDGIWEVDGVNIKTFNMKKVVENNKINHIFNNPEHKLSNLGLTPESTYEKMLECIIQKDLAGEISANEIFKLRVKISGYEVEVRGIVCEGELKYGTFFIPKD